MTYLLRNSITGAFFNGTNFSEGDIAKAAHFDLRPDDRLVRFVWGDNAVIVAQFNENPTELTATAPVTATGPDDPRFWSLQKI